MLNLTCTGQLPLPTVATTSWFCARLDLGMEVVDNVDRLLINKPLPLNRDVVIGILIFRPLNEGGLLIMGLH